MRIDSLQMVELLSLEDKHGRCAMRLCVGLDNEEVEGLRELEVELDQATYRALRKLDPLSTGRVRLSLYTKYDPFRHTYFSNIVKLNTTGSESYYFDCTADYEVILGRLRRGETAEMAEGANRAAASPMDIQTSGSPSVPAISLPFGSIASSIGASLRLRMGRYAMTSLRMLMLTCMFLLVWFEVEGQLYIDDAKALSEHQLVISEGAGEGAKQGGGIVHEYAALAAGGAADNAEEPADTVTVDATNHADLAQSVTSGGGSEAGGTEPGVTDDASAASTVENVSFPDSDNERVEVITLSGDAPLYKLPDGYVALTFDDGPSDYTKAIVDLLRERGVAGTFLFVGRNADRYPENAAYASEHGMAVGNHSWDHSDLTKFEMDDISANIEQANEAIAKRSTVPVSVFRPPYGAMNDEVEIAAEELGLKVLMWNRDPEDWKADTSSDIVRYFKQLSASGGIYVMHEKKATLDALPDIIDYLLEQKLKFAVFQ